VNSRSLVAETAARLPAEGLASAQLGEVGYRFRNRVPEKPKYYAALVEPVDIDVKVCFARNFCNCLIINRLQVGSLVRQSLCLLLL
jgi:hypothetical protein